MVKCKPDYKNLNHIQSFSEQSYATVQWAKQVCQNDEWLRQQVEQLRYLTPPAIRKRYPIKGFFDKSQSYGCKVNGSEVGFDDIGPEKVTVDFNDMSLVNVAKSESVDFVTEEDINYCRLKTHDINIPAVSKSFGTSTGGTNNSFWYVGYNKSKNYNLKADWLKNWKNHNIPSVARAQTFKVPDGCGGILTSVDLKLDYNGSKNLKCGSPLYVQIWKTYESFRTKTVWNKTKKIMEYKYILASTAGSEYNGYQRYEKYQKKLKYTSGKKKGQYKYKNGNVVTETAYRKKDNGAYVREREWVRWLGHNKQNPDGTWANNISHPLAEATYDKVGDPWPNIKFEKPCEIKAGKTYAIVVFSPLSDWKHCPLWGGWGRNCKRDKVYPDGHAFMSEDNGKTWKRYGKNGVDTDPNGKKLEYKKGKYTPQDFAFQCHVETSPAGIETRYNTDVAYLYLTPILSNPIIKVELDAVDKGSEAAENPNLHVEYEVSVDGDDWKSISNGGEVNFSEEYNDNLPTMLLVRAKLWTDDDGNTPHIESINIRLKTNPAKEMYARTAFHMPRLESMLGANIWGRIYAPFVEDSTVDCQLEIIQGESVTDHFNIIKLSEVDEKLSELGLFEKYPEVSSLENEERAIYLTNNPEIITDLKQLYTYIIPYEINDKLYLLSFAASYSSEDMIITRSDSDDMFSGYDVGGLSFSNEVAYPILSVRTQTPVPESADGVNAYSEWVDFTFDYDKNQLFFKPSTLDDLVEGDLEVTYNPVFISGLSPDEVGTHIDAETGLESDGLILDYFKEKIIISSNHLETKRVPLRAKPTDPIRQVYVYDSSFGEDAEPVELFEDKDFILDIETNELVFSVDVNGNVLSIGKGDILQVVYTPYLDDSRIALGYFAKRTDTNMQIHIKDVYFEVKA